MPLRLFLSAGEPSGDLHAANLIQQLRQLRPDLECVGFGGERLAAAGCQLLYPLSQLAVMWFLRVLARAPRFLELLSRADRYFHHQRPDAVVLIDYPGFNWWLARRAHYHGIPVYYFVPPQLWAWAGWRVRKMRRWVNHVLCTLPFEQDWYVQRGVSAHYVGHPYFDELAAQQLDDQFMNEQQTRGGTIIGLLPGSRTQEVERNGPTLLRAAELIHAACPDTRFLVACYRDRHRQLLRPWLRPVRAPVEVCAGRTPEIIALAHSCLAVSGSVSLELLYRGKPAVIVYRVGRLLWHLGPYFITCKYITLVNLLADRLLFPEYPSLYCEAEAAAGHICRWLHEPATYQQLCCELAQLRQQVAQPGACARAARYLLDTLLQRQTPAAA